MKKITFLILSMMLSFGAFAQNITSLNGDKGEKPTKANDITIVPKTFATCAQLSERQEYMYSGADSKGYVTGSNNYYDRGYAMVYNLKDPMPIKGVVVHIGKKGTGTFTGKIKLFNLNADKKTIGSEITSVDYSSANLSSMYNEIYEFANSQTLKDFAVGVTIPVSYNTTRLSIVIGSTKKSCASGKAYKWAHKGAGFDQVQESSFEWKRFFGDGSMNIEDLDLFIFPITEIDGDYDMIIDEVGPVGLNRVDVNEYSSVFPNPSNGEINVISSFKINNIDIVNMMGQSVVKCSVNDYTKRIDVSNLIKGSYIVKIYTNEGVATKKVVVR